MTGNVNKTNIFTRPLGSSKTSQSRGGYVPSQHSTNFNPFDHNTNTINRNRSIYEHANRYAGRVNARPVTQSGFTNDINKMAEIAMYTQLGMQAGQTLLGLTKGIMDLVDSKPAGGGPAVLKSAATLQGANSAAITSMQSATTASDLRAAINNAETLASTLTSDIQNIEAELLPGLKQAAEEAQTKINDLNNQITDQYTSIKEQEGNVNTAKNSVKSCQDSLASKQNALTKADADYSSACTNYTNARIATAQAQAAAESAQNILSSTPKEITNPDGTTIPNPAYETAEQAYKNALTELANAQNDEDKAKIAKEEKYGQLTDLKTAVDEAQTAYDKAADQLVNAEEKLATEQEKLKTMQNELKELEAQRAEEQKSVDAYENIQKELKDKKAELSAIKAEIPAQKTRLAELEKAEEAKVDSLKGQIDGYEDQINDRTSQITYSDGLNSKERKLERQNEKDEKTMSGLRSQLTSALDLFNDSKNAAIKDAKTNGETTYQGVRLTYENGTFTYNGKTFTEDEIAANL